MYNKDKIRLLNEVAKQYDFTILECYPERRMIHLFRTSINQEEFPPTITTVIIIDDKEISIEHVYEDIYTNYRPDFYKIDFTILAMLNKLREILVFWYD